MELMGLEEWTLLGNTLIAWTIAAAVAVGTYLALLVVRRMVVGQLRALDRRTEAEIGPVAVASAVATRQWFLVLVALRAGSLALVMSPRVAGFVETAVIVGVVVQLALWANAAVAHWIDRYSERRRDEDAAAVTSMRAIVFLARLGVWTVVLLVALDNLGIRITAVVAGFGIGGIAVALAVQNILGDLFASLSIVIDKPFVIGDFIIVDDLLGTVEHIGLKTTRVKSLSGEQLVFSNTDLLNSRIRNFKRMAERRVVFTFGVVYQTPADKLEKVSSIVREIIENIELARFDRAHFKEFSAYSLLFEVVYHVLVPDFNQYMDVQQQINLQIYRRLEAEGVTFAYPTQTLYLEQAATGDGAKGLASKVASS